MAMKKGKNPENRLRKSFLSGSYKSLKFDQNFPTFPIFDKTDFWQNWQQAWFNCHWLTPSYQCKHRQGARLKTLYLHSINFPSRQHSICQLSTGFQHLSLAIIKYFNSSQLTSSESLPIRSKLWQSQPRQHCRLTICIELVELTNSIRWQDPNNNTDTETRCLVYPRSEPRLELHHDQLVPGQVQSFKASFRQLST